jgi:hypothetical protein
MWMVIGLLTISTLQVVLGTINVDQQTTIDVGTVVSTSVAVLCGFVAAPFAARGFFGGDRDSQYRRPMWRMRRDRVGVWFLCGILWIVVAAVAFAWEAANLVGIVAQYLPGERQSVRGIVISDDPVATARAICRERLIVRDESDEELHICLRKTFGRSLSTVPITQGERVIVTMTVNSLGRVAVSVTPIHG